MTHILFPTPSFLSGYARVIDLGSVPRLANTCSTPKQADDLALRADLFAVAADVCTASPHVLVPRSR